MLAVDLSADDLFATFPELKGMIEPPNGHRPTLEEVFIELTGRPLVEEDELI